MKGNVKWINIALVFIIGFMLSGCTEFLDEEKYTGAPQSLSYMQMDVYNIGDEYVSVQPTVLGGENATFSITSASGPVDESIILDAIEVSEDGGIISINEFSALLPGSYSVDVQVSNAYGSEVFTDAFLFNAVQVAPTKVKYLPSIYSFYYDEIDVRTEEAYVKGGGPYSFELDDPLNHFSIDVETGAITKEQVVDVDDQDQIITKIFDVSVSNELGNHTEADAITIEIIGKNVGKLIYNNELAASSIASKGLLNAKSFSFYGDYTAMVNGEEYTTTLVEGTNTTGYKGSRYYNAWHSYPANIKLDQTGSGEVESRQFLCFKTASSKTECVSMVVTDSIDLTNATSATTDILAYKRYIDSDINQRFGLLICDNETYDAENPSRTNWTEIEHNIAPGMLSWKSPFVESKLYGEGRQEFEIPLEFVGKTIRLALIAEHLNASINNLGRETFIYKWQVRAK